MIEVHGVAVYAVEVGCKDTKVMAIAIQEGMVLFIFTLPNHNRVLRQWFRAQGIRSTPRPGWKGHTDSVFLVDITGDIVQTNTPYDDIKAEYVLGNVSIKEATDVT